MNSVFTIRLKSDGSHHEVEIEEPIEGSRDRSMLPKETRFGGYGVLIEDRGYSNRAYFLLDRDGIVRWEHVEANPGQRRPDAELLEAIDRLT